VSLDLVAHLAIQLGRGSSQVIFPVAPRVEVALLLSLALVANQVAASSNFAASKATQPISDAVCIAFVAAAARSLVFSLVAARSASAFLNCASRVARSGFVFFRSHR